MAKSVSVVGWGKEEWVGGRDQKGHITTEGVGYADGLNHDGGFAVSCIYQKLSSCTI